MCQTNTNLTIIKLNLEITSTTNRAINTEEQTVAYKKHGHE